MPKTPPAPSSDQPGRRATNKLYIRFEPDVRTALAELQAQRHPASANSLVNQAVREYCARELGAREPETFESVINHALDIALEDARRAKETTA